MNRKSYFLLIFVIFFSISIHGEENEGDEVAYLTAVDVEEIVNERYPEYQNSGYYKQLDIIKKAIKNDAISDSFTMLIMSEAMENHHSGMPNIIRASWASLFTKKTTNLKFIGYFASFLTGKNRLEQDFAPWMLPFDKEFKKAIGKTEFIKDEQELRNLTLKYIDIKDKASQGFLIAREYEGLLKPIYNSNYYDIPALIASINSEPNDISALFIFAEGSDLVNLPSNLTRSWALLASRITKNKKIIYFSLIVNKANP